MDVAVTHLVPWTSSPNHLAHYSFGTAASMLLAKHVLDANSGIKVYPVNPAFVMSTDNTTIHINDSKDANNKDFILLALRDVGDSLRNKKSKNYFISSSKSSGMGMRIRLKESEMPSSIYPEGICVKEVPGLSNAGA
eukprot:2879265-Ditylum_brightwellii.AAC.1